MTWQHQKIPSPCGCNVPEAHALASLFLIDQGLEGGISRRLDAQDGNREACRPAVMHDPGFFLWPPGHVDGYDYRPLQALGGVNGDERDRLLLGIWPSLDLAYRLFPIGPHIAREGPQTTHIIGARHLQIEVDIGERTLRSGLEPLSQLRAHIQCTGCIGK